MEAEAAGGASRNRSTRSRDNEREQRTRSRTVPRPPCPRLELQHLRVQQHDGGDLLDGLNQHDREEIQRERLDLRAGGATGNCHRVQYWYANHECDECTEARAQNVFYQRYQRD